MNYYDSDYYRMYAEHQKMLRNYHTSFLMEPNYVNTNYRNWKSWFSDKEMNNLRFLVLAKEVMSVERNFGKKEEVFLMNLYKVNCGERFTKHYAQLLRTIFTDCNNELEWALNIKHRCYNNNKEIVRRLFELTSLSGQVTLNEFLFVKNIAERTGITRSDFMGMLKDFNIDNRYRDNIKKYNQGFGNSPSASFLAQAPRQYYHNQKYKDWRELCYSLDERKNDIKNLSFLVLAAVVITADGPINKAELDFIKKIYANRYPSERHTLIYILKLRDILKEPNIDWGTYADNLYNTFYEEDKYKTYHWGKSKKEEILEALFKLAEVDSQISQNELKALWAIAKRLEINQAFQKIASNFDIENEHDDSCGKTMSDSPLAKAYITLQISENATDEMVIKAYRKMSMLFHPDRCHNDFQRPIYESKMQEINEAYKTIMNYRKNKRRA